MQQQYVSPNHGRYATGYAALLLILLVLAWGLVPGIEMDGREVWVFALLFATAVTMFKIQDTVTVDSDLKTLTVLRRRLLLPNAVYRSAGADVRDVVVTAVAGEGPDECTYLAHVRPKDGREFAVTRYLDDKELVDAEASRWLEALGREDLRGQG